MNQILEVPLPRQGGGTTKDGGCKHTLELVFRALGVCLRPPSLVVPPPCHGNALPGMRVRVYVPGEGGGVTFSNTH
jgi:hypothetical protein